MVWSHLNVNQQHIGYLCIAVVCILFAFTSKFIKNRLFLSEAIVLAICGIILGHCCLDWVKPFIWSTNVDVITIELSRIILCIQLFVSGLELPKAYMYKNFKSVFLLLIPVMTAGWLIVGSFIYLVIPQFKYKHGLLISGCITATDPVLSQSIVSGRYAQKNVPQRLRDLLIAESGSNDGMAFPFVYLAIFLITLNNRKGEILKEFFVVTVLYECVFGTLAGLFLGYISKRIMKIAFKYQIMDRESVYIYYIFLAILMAGMGSLLGMDELLITFFGGCAFGWDGWFKDNFKEANETFIPSIDYLLNMLYFTYFGSIIPWKSFNNLSLNLNIWRLIIIGVVVVFLRRLPVIFGIYRWVPAIKNFKEALLVGWFGPIGVGAIYTSLLAKMNLEKKLHHLTSDPAKNKHKIDDVNIGIETVWTICCFIVVVSMIIHGLTVPVMLATKYLWSLTKKSSSKSQDEQDDDSGDNETVDNVDVNTFVLHEVDKENVKHITIT